MYKEIIVDADLCLKLGSSEKYRYLEMLLPQLAEKIYIHETVNDEIKTGRGQISLLIQFKKVEVLSIRNLSGAEEQIYNATYDHLASVMINKNEPNKNKGEVSSLAMAKVKSIPYFATDERNLQPIIDAILNTGICTESSPIPRIPDRYHIEPHADRQQEFVIQRWIGGQANQVEQEKEGGNDDIRPATHGLGQYKGQKNHQDRNQHKNRDPQPNELA